jgi:hypothetical protein
VDMAFIGAQTLKAWICFLGQNAPPALCDRIQTLFFDSCYRLSSNEFNIFSI